jgi:hypothetical protein
MLAVLLWSLLVEALASDSVGLANTRHPVAGPQFPAIRRGDDSVNNGQALFGRALLAAGSAKAGAALQSASHAETTKTAMSSRAKAAFAKEAKGTEKVKALAAKEKAEKAAAKAKKATEEAKKKAAAEAVVEAKTKATVVKEVKKKEKKKEKKKAPVKSITCHSNCKACVGPKWWQCTACPANHFLSAGPVASSGAVVAECVTWKLADYGRPVFTAMDPNNAEAFSKARTQTFVKAASTYQMVWSSTPPVSGSGRFKGKMWYYGSKMYKRLTCKTKGGRIKCKQHKKGWIDQACHLLETPHDHPEMNQELNKKAAVSAHCPSPGVKTDMQKATNWDPKSLGSGGIWTWGRQFCCFKVPQLPRGRVAAGSAAGSAGSAAGSADGLPNHLKGAAEMGNERPSAKYSLPLF